MPYLMLIVVTSLVGLVLWKVVKWITKRETPGKEIKPSQNKETNSAASVQSSTSNSGPLSPVIVLPSDQKLNTKSTERPNQPYSGSAEVLASNREGIDGGLQQKLYQEIKRRENAEDWADFLARELDAHIKACTKAEQRYKKLAIKLDPASQQVLKENSNEPFIRTFKSLNEAQVIWSNSLNTKGNIRQETSGIFSKDKQHDEAEWSEIVEANLRYLQATSQQKTSKQNATNETTLKTRQNKSHMCQCCLNSQLKTDNQRVVSVNKSRNTALDECRSPEKLNVEEMKEQVTRSNDDYKLDLRNLIEQDQKLANENEMLDWANPAVCTESIDDIKKTTQLWENLSIPKERLSSSDDLSPSCPKAEPTTPDKMSIQESLGDITTGQVKRNSKLWENS